MCWEYDNEFTHHNPSRGIFGGENQVLGRQQFVYDVDDSIGIDDITGYDLSLIIYIHCVLKLTKKRKKEMSTKLLLSECFINMLNHRESECLSRAVGKIWESMFLEPIYSLWLQKESGGDPVTSPAKVNSS